MKSYTNAEQSRKLAEILPTESADMCYAYDIAYVIPYKNGIGTEEPCWSLAALLDYLSSNFYIDIKYLDTNWELDCRVQVNYERELIDACVEMIFKLKERDLL